MANIRELILSIESDALTFDEKLAALTQVEETLVAMQQQEEDAVQENVDLIVEAIKVMQEKVDAQVNRIADFVPEKGEKGDKGERGLDGRQGVDGKDGRDGVNGRDGKDGVDGISVVDAKIDFDGSLIITLSTGKELNVGEVVAPDLAEKIKLVTSGGAGTVLPSQTGNSGKYLKTDGSALSWATVSSGSGTVTSVGGTGTVNGISLSGTVTTSGNLTLGGTLDLSSPPTIGNTAANTGAFTTLSASSTVSGTGFSTYLASPPAIGGTTASTGRFTTVTSTVATGTAPFTVASTTAVANLSIGGNAATVTNGVYTTDTGTVTNTMLAGSIANAKLSNSTITFGATSQALGSTVSGLTAVTLDNGAVGATTASTGKFTTLESTGTASLATGSTTSIQIVGDASYPQVKATGGTNTPLVLQPLGTGALQAQKTDSAATGGNARGANATDWQTIRAAAAQVASGTTSTVSGGQNNTASNANSTVVGGATSTASGNGAVAGGNSSTASGTTSVSFGNQNLSNANYSTIAGGQYGTSRSIIGYAVFPACNSPIAASAGVSQGALLVLAVATTDATATVLRSNTSAASATNQVALPVNSAYFFKGEIIAGVTAAGDAKGWSIEGVIKRATTAASTALVGTPTVTSLYADAGASTWSVAVTADTTNAALKITVTGQASTTIRWVAQIRTTEMTY